MSSKELIEPPHEIICYALKVGDWFKERNITHWKLADCASRDALEAADKRIAELEELLDERHEDYRRERDRLNEENSAVLECLKEAERKLSVAREVLKTIRWTPQMGELWKIAEEALAQIGGEE